MILKRGPLTSQAAYAGRLNGFCESASTVLGEDDGYAVFYGNFIYKLGEVLISRQNAIARPKKLPAILVPSTSGTELLSGLRQRAELIQREVVSLQVLIKTFKAQNRPNWLPEVAKW